MICLPNQRRALKIDEEAREQGINYYDVTQAAARGDQNALKTFFNIHVDGGAAEEHDGVTCVVIHLIGDDAYAKFLREQSRDFVSVEGGDIMCHLMTKNIFASTSPSQQSSSFPTTNG
jgi:hypothetical protein